MLHRLTTSQVKRMHAMRDKIGMDEQAINLQVQKLMRQDPLHASIVSTELSSILGQLALYDTCGHYSDLRYFNALLSRGEQLASLFSRQLYN